MIKLMMILALFSLPLQAAPPITDGDLKHICESATKDLGNGNYKTIHTVFAKGEKLSLVSSYDLTPDSNSLLVFDNETAKMIYGIHLAKDKVVDIQMDGDFAWALTNDKNHQSKLYRIVLAPGENQFNVDFFPTINKKFEAGTYSKAYGLSSDSDNVYIAHGNQGLVVFSKEYLKPVQNIENTLNTGTSQISYMTDVLKVGEQIVTAWDNQTYDFNKKTRAFEGYVFLNSDYQSVHQATINQKREALFEPKLFLDGDNIVMSTWTLHFVNSIKNLRDNKTFTPQRRIYKYERGKPVGLAFVKDSKISGCFVDDKQLPPTGFALEHKY